MRISISNIAWDVTEDRDMVELLHRYKIDAIDLAPSKYFPHPALATDKDIASVRAWWADQGIEIIGLQALLFGTKDLNLFGSVDVRRAMLSHLQAVSRVAAGLGATRIVLGSPKNRDRSDLSDPEVLDVALPFFRDLGDSAAANGVQVCLEPNPTRYACNFMTTSTETIDVVTQVDHPSIRMQLDTGAITINGEDVDTVLGNCWHLIGHVHASEPDLLPLGDGTTDHVRMHAALNRYLPEKVVTIEMLATKDEPHLASIERALGLATCIYRQAPAKERT